MHIQIDESSSSHHILFNSFRFFKAFVAKFTAVSLRVGLAETSRTSRSGNMVGMISLRHPSLTYEAGMRSSRKVGTFTQFALRSSDWNAAALLKHEGGDRERKFCALPSSTSNTIIKVISYTKERERERGRERIPSIDMLKQPSICNDVRVGAQCSLKLRQVRSVKRGQ